ncbi:MAG: YybS family protein [Alphaproteobacteria bacterium]|nr:YybS family protein [Alphaproteobacteria bacterium]
MYRFWLVAGSAGLASAAAFLIGVMAGLGGSYAGFMLVYLSPAPLFAAALGLGGSASIVAAVAGSVPVALAGGLPAGLGYAVVAAAPTAILGRQAMLSRSNEEGRIEWYPPGALAGWLCGIGAVTYILLCILLASQPAGLSGTVREMLTQLAAWMEVPDDDRELFIGLLHPILPGTAVAFLMLVQVANGALAQGLLSAANRAVRPAPDLGALELPGWIAIAGAVAALAALVVGGEFEYFARNLVIIAAVPFFLQGLSVVHVLARRTGGGAMLLAVFYVTLVVLGWVAIVLVLLGLVEQIIGLRRRMNTEDKV